jgi:hypothetical protein
LSERTEIWPPAPAADPGSDTDPAALTAPVRVDETRVLSPDPDGAQPWPVPDGTTVSVPTVEPRTEVAHDTGVDVGRSLDASPTPVEASTAVVDAPATAAESSADGVDVGTPSDATSVVAEPAVDPAVTGRASSDDAPDEPAPATSRRDPERGPTGSLPLPLGVTAALIGEYRWIEHALYALLGRWVEEAPLPSVQVMLDAQSMRHAWHAELWADRLPVLASTDPDRLTVPSTPTAVLFGMLGVSVPRGAGIGERALTGFEIELRAEDGEPVGTLPRLAALYRLVLPRLVASYESHLAAAAEPTDGPVIRALRLVRSDEIEDWRAGERLVERLMTRPHDVAVVGDYLRRLESALVGAGARSGLVRIPASGEGR